MSMIQMKKRILVILFMIAASFNPVNAQSDITPGVIKQTSKKIVKAGQFITIKGANGNEYRVFAAGPEQANSAVLFVHDFFGISTTTRESVERLGALGYYTIAVDLYKGKSATNGDSASALMKAKDDRETKIILQTAIDHLKKPGRKLASAGFSAGGIDALKANLAAPDLFSATIIVYGGNYDQLEKETLDKLKSPLLAITGSLDNWALQSALNFLQNQKDKLFELYVYAGADHGYAQPLFKEGQNYNTDATRVTWMLIEDFLTRNLK